MPRTPGSEFIVVLAALAVLPDCPWAADCLWAHGDDHRLHYDFSIAFNKQPRCMVQGQLDGNNYLFYDCENDKVISMDFLREEVMGTDAWKDQTKTLRDMGDLIRQHLSDIEPEKYADGAPFALQVRMICQCTAGGRTRGSWEFFSDGQRLLVFDAESGEYRADNSRGEQMKDEWERDDALTKAFNFYSTRDCQGWLQFLVPRKKELETTASLSFASHLVFFWKCFKSTSSQLLRGLRSLLTHVSSSVAAGVTGCTNYSHRHSHSPSPSPSPVQSHNQHSHHLDCLCDPHLLGHSWLVTEDAAAQKLLRV